MLVRLPPALTSSDSGPIGCARYGPDEANMSLFLGSSQLPTVSHNSSARGNPGGDLGGIRGDQLQDRGRFDGMIFDCLLRGSVPSALSPHIST